MAQSHAQRFPGDAGIERLPVLFLLKDDFFQQSLLHRTLHVLISNENITELILIVNESKKVESPPDGEEELRNTRKARKWKPR